MNDEEDRRYCAGPHDWEAAHAIQIHGLQRCRLCGILRMPDPRWRAVPTVTGSGVAIGYPFDLSNTEQP